MNTSFAATLSENGYKFPKFLQARRAVRRQYVEGAQEYLHALRVAQPERVNRLVDDATRIMSHRFDILGSGIHHFCDPDRPISDSGYVPIDWHLDPVRGLRFPRGIWHKDWRLYEMRPENADVKYPWELSRSQHLVALGQAWQVTYDERFSSEIISQIDDFMESNPVGYSVNWTCTMDVAIRAANWCLALALIVRSAVSESDLERAYAALFDHGVFIKGNLENFYEVTSNHFLSNVVGLHFLASEFAGLSVADEWDVFARKALETEIDTQILADGADFESAVPYHRLVTELFMGSARLAAFQGRPLSSHFLEVLLKMLDFLTGVIRPDGLMPVIGDADDGRLHIFSDYGSWDRQDARHLFAPAGKLLSQDNLLLLSGSLGAWEAAWWGFDPVGIPDDAAGIGNSVRMFKDSGISVARLDGNYLAVTNGVVGTKGFGNHKHNELLGFEFHVASQPIFIDTGSYVYTSDFAARNSFRSTAAHNTVMIDSVEQNEVNPEWVFRMFEKAQPEILDFRDTDGIIHWRGRHHGYARLEKPVIHERSFNFESSKGALDITDLFTGIGVHRLEWFFYGASGVTMTLRSPNLIEVKSKTAQVVFAHDERLSSVIENAWSSPSYGVKVPVQRIRLTWIGDVAGSLELKIKISAIQL